MKTDPSGRVALVTGGGRGIGRSIDLALADAGARVFLTARSADQLEGTARDIRERGHEAELLPADVASEEGMVNISSVVGFKGYPNQAAYAASKHAVMGITKSLAVEAQPHAVSRRCFPARWRPCSSYFPFRIRQQSTKFVSDAVPARRSESCE
jgi:NAD(P)-dependent dehydrogenase (short-subunit alcohol dehydrogenase family)